MPLFLGGQPKRKFKIDTENYEHDGTGRLYAAGLDVTNPGPLPPDSPLWAMDNLIISPLLAAAGPDSARCVALVAIENLRRYVAGEALLNVLDLRRGN